MFEMSDAIAFGTMVLGGSGISITAICKWKRNGNSAVPEKLCRERHGSVKEDIGEIKATQEKIFGEIKELRKDIAVRG
jgi:hypothetical protein